MEKELLEKIKKELPTGARKEIAIIAGVSYSLVTKFFEGKTDNIKVCKALIEVYSDYKRTLNELAALAE